MQYIHTRLWQRLQAYTIAFLTHPRSLAATWRISFDFFSSGYLDVSLPLLVLYNLLLSAIYARPSTWRVSPFGYPRIYAYLTAPRGFSQPITSFFDSGCPGIHRGPFISSLLLPYASFKVRLEGYKNLQKWIANQLQYNRLLT